MLSHHSYAVLYEQAAELFREQNQIKRSSVAYALAIEQWEGIDNHARADELRIKLVEKTDGIVQQDGEHGRSK